MDLRSFNKKIDFVFETYSRLNPEITSQAYVPETSPSDKEIGWLGHYEGKKSIGDEASVQIEFDPNNPKIKDSFIYHTHPSNDPSPLTAMPSIVDLESVASMAKKHKIKGSTIFSGHFYTVIVPTSRACGKKDPKPYEDALKRGDIEDALKALEEIGFDVETGKL